jgi:hypothetical protein
MRQKTGFEANCDTGKSVRRTDFPKCFHCRRIALRPNGRKRSVSPRVLMIRVRAMCDQVIKGCGANSVGRREIAYSSDASTS